MKISLCLDGVKPISLNNNQKFTSKKGGYKYKTDNAKQFESFVNLELRKFKNGISRFNKKYDEQLHYVVAEYRFFMPIMTVKDKRVSKTSGDLSNLVKALEDIIFKQLNADDSCVTALTVYKIESKEIRTEIEYHIRDLHHIN